MKQVIDIHPPILAWSYGKCKFHPLQHSVSIPENIYAIAHIYYELTITWEKIAAKSEYFDLRELNEMTSIGSRNVGEAYIVCSKNLM